MKRMMKFWMLTAVVALVSTACTKYDEVDVVSQGEGLVVTFTTDEIGGRTAFGESTDNGATYPTLWKDGDQVKISMGLDISERSFLKDPATSVSPKITAMNEGKYASFTVTVSEQEGGYAFYAVYPGTMWQHANDRAGGLMRLEIPATQAATATSCDPSAQLLFATATADALPESMLLQFEHIAAYGRFSLKGLSDGEKVTSVKLTSSKVISGRFFYHAAETDESERVDVTSSSSGLSKTITLTTSSADVWFAALPVDLSNTTLKVEVTTNKTVYTKSLALGADRKLQSGRIAKMTIDLADATAVPREDVMVGDVWYEAGKPVGVVFWVSDDKETVKVVHLQRTAQKIAWSDNTNVEGLSPGSDANPDGAENTAKLQTKYAGSIASVPMLEYLNSLNVGGNDWYWPSRNEFREICIAYEGMSGTAWGTFDDNVNTPDKLAAERRAAQITFDKILIENGGVALNTLADGDAGGDASDDKLSAGGDYYWVSNEASSGTKANYTRVGKAYEATQTKTTAYCYGRAIKTITNVKSRKLEEQLRAASWSSQTLREGVKVHSASLSLFGRLQQIYVTEITPSAANQIGIYHAGADTPKQVAAQAVSAGALAAVNGGFFPMAGATPKTGFVKINGVVKEQGDDDLNSTFAGGALVINGTTPGIVKVAGNEAARELPDENVMVCGPLLLLDGKATTLSASSDHTTSFAQRTVVGVTENGTFLMVTIHGRATPITGMSGLELQKLMAGLRAKDALNLDGGGSTALWANGDYIYSTTRSVANIVYIK